MTAEPSNRERRVLILAPSGRDATLAAQVIEQADMAPEICEDAEALLAGISEGAGTAVVANEALDVELMPRLVRLLQGQPAWSDFPLLIFIQRTTTAPENRRALESLSDLGNVTALERPIHPLMLSSAVGAALRARTRQYAARRVLEEREDEVRQRDHFMALLGHELRNPLGALRNAAALAQRKGSEVPGLDRPLAIMDRQLRHLSQLVDDLLDVARVTSGKISLKLIPVDLAALTRGLVEEIQRAGVERRLIVYLHAPMSPVVVQGDPMRIEQILNNLLTNALKYTPPGGRIDVSLSGDVDAVLTVADTGVGISADVLPTIFNPFTQATHSLDRSQGGMGLGLSVVRALVQLHGGQVTVASPGLGRGSAFTVRLPLAARQELPAPEITPAVAPALEPLRILVVEDGADHRESLQELLEAQGHTVDVAIDGEQGIERALVFHPDVALIDIGLPRLDGYEVARRVRAFTGAETFLVALTGYGQPEDRARAVAAGFDVHLTKPVDLRSLERLLSRVRQAASPAPASV